MWESREYQCNAAPRRWLALGVPVLLALAAMPVLAAKKPEPAVFRTIAKVVVAPSGEATSIEPDPALPAELQDLVRRRAAGMRFEPTTSAVGQAMATTYLRFGGCIFPDGDEIRVALDYKANGPRPLPGPDPALPNYPREAYTQGLEAEAKVIFVVQPDGSAVIEEIAYIRASSRKIWDRAIGEWVGRMRYAPEELDGVAIRTRVEMPVQFYLGDASRSRPRREVEKPECVAASKGGDDPSQPVALDSPVRIVPSG